MQLQRIKLIPFIAFLVMLLVLISLGVWQLNRAEEKRQIIALQDQRKDKEIVSLTDSTLDDHNKLLYNKVQVTGHFDINHQFLLDNQVRDGKAGYYVLTPIRLKNQTKAVLVNRGWLPLGRNRNELPEISLKAKELTVFGRANHFPSPGIKLAGAEIPGKTWPAVVQVVDAQVLAKYLGYNLFNFQVELDQNSPDGFKRDWKHKEVMPLEKHLAYAGQWFLLAMTLTLLFFKYGIKNK